MNTNLTTNEIEGIVLKLSLKEGTKYAGVSYNTLMKYRTMDLQVCKIDGVKRISSKEIPRFFQEHSF